MAAAILYTMSGAVVCGTLYLYQAILSDPLEVITSRVLLHLRTPGEATRRRHTDVGKAASLSLPDTVACMR